MNVDSNTVYYLLSTLAQTSAAVMAAIGAISVFRYETVSTLQGSSWKRIEKNLSELGCEFFPSQPTEKILQWWDRQDKEKSESQKWLLPTDYMLVEKEIPWLRWYSEWRGRMRCSLMIFLGYHMFFVIIPSLIFINFSRWLMCNKGWMFVGLIIVLALSIFVIFLVLCSLMSGIGEDQEQEASPFKRFINLLTKSGKSILDWCSGLRKSKRAAA